MLGWKLSCCFPECLFLWKQKEENTRNMEYSFFYSSDIFECSECLQRTSLKQNQKMQRFKCFCNMCTGFIFSTCDFLEYKRSFRTNGLQVNNGVVLDQTRVAFYVKWLPMCVEPARKIFNQGCQF